MLDRSFVVRPQLIASEYVAASRQLLLASLALLMQVEAVYHQLPELRELEWREVRVHVSAASLWLPSPTALWPGP